MFDYYPEAVLVDYQSKNTYGWLKDVGFTVVFDNINHTVGNRSSEDAYNVRPRIGSFNEAYNMRGQNNAVYENTPFNCFLADANTNFELYDVADGMLIKDMTVAQNEDVAYHIAWVNATAKERSYSVVVAYYNGDTLVTKQVVKENP